jgi:hypothetical protein
MNNPNAPISFKDWQKNLLRNKIYWLAQEVQSITTFWEQELYERVSNLMKNRGMNREILVQTLEEHDEIYSNVRFRIIDLYDCIIAWANTQQAVQNILGMG